MKRIAALVAGLMLVALLATGVVGTPTNSARSAPLTSTYYISPSGNDSWPGTQAQPWKTFAHAIPLLYAGDTLVLRDGTYTKTTTGLPDINCNSGAHNGTSGAHITIKAENERAAWLQSDGSVAAFRLRNCSFYDLWGLRGSGADLASGSGGAEKSVFDLDYNADLTLKRLLSAYNNRYFNDHTYEIAYSQRVLIEECEAYYFHRHGFSLYQDTDVTVRRSYANSRNYADIPGGYVSNVPSGGDEAFALYGSSDSIIENSVAQNISDGFEIHGYPNYGGGMGGQDNKIIGSIVVGYGTAGAGAKVDSRLSGGVYYPASNNLYENDLYYQNGGTNVQIESAVGDTFRNITIYDTANNAVRSKETYSTAMCGAGGGLGVNCSFTMTNALIYDVGDYGVLIQNTSNNDWLVTHSNIHGTYRPVDPAEIITDTTGHVQDSMTVTPTHFDASTHTPVYIPADSNMYGAGEGGANIGATILYRYQDGTLTADPLWSPGTGKFACGAIVTGLSDTLDSCDRFNETLNVTSSTLPADYNWNQRPEVQLPWLATVGNHIVRTDTGQTVQLRGVEMLRNEWTGSMEFEEAAFPVIQNQWGANFITHDYSSAPVAAQDPAYLAQLDEYVNLAAQYGMYINLCLYTTEINGDQPPSLDQDPNALAAEEILMQRYRDRSNVMFQLQSEPHSDWVNGISYRVTWNSPDRNGYDVAVQLRPIYDRFITDLRAIDNPAPYKHLLIVSGDGYGRDISPVVVDEYGVGHPDPITADGAQNVIYTSHPYDPPSEWGYWLPVAQDGRYAVIITGFGTGGQMSQSDTEQLMQLMNQMGISWTTWIFDNEGCPCLLGGTDRFTFTPSNPFGLSVQAHIRAEANLGGGTPTPTRTATATVTPAPTQTPTCHVYGTPDFLALVRAMGTHIGEPNYNPSADYNGDGYISAIDFVILRSYFGRCL